MSNLAMISLALSAVMGTFYVLMIIAPSGFRNGLKAFPRMPVIGWVFTVVAVAWASWHLWNMSLGRFDIYKPYLYGLAPLTAGLVMVCMDELLAVRSLGALLALVPAPIFQAARTCDSPWRIVMVVLAYMIAIKGIYFIFSPHLFRDWTGRFIASDGVCRALGVGGFAIMLLVAILAFTVY